MYRAGPSDFGLLRLALRLRIRPGVSSVQLAQSKAKPQRYRRRQPEFTVLYRVVQRHWQTYRERAEASGPLPQFVVDEFEQYLRCGVLAHGAVLVACVDCSHERLVGLSCKGRAFCPSCLGRRMNDSAAFLIDHVLPQEPLRQWVCTLPWELRYLAGYDKQLASELVGAFVKSVLDSLRRRAKHELGLRSVTEAHAGAVTFIQRFDSALRLNPHAHTEALDGVYVEQDGQLVFHPLGEPSAEDIEYVARRTFERAKQLLRRRGLLNGERLEADGCEDPLQTDQPALADCYGTAVRGIEQFGNRSGQPTLRLIDPAAATEGLERTVAAVTVGGFNIYAGRAIEGRDRKQLERQLRYLGRPPLAQHRLQELADGRVRYRMKRSWKDGTTSLVFDPLDFIGRLAALVPPARFNMVRYHGVLAPNAKLRSRIVPAPTDNSRPAQLDLFDKTPMYFDGSKYRLRWASLLKRTFREDLEVCERCGGRARIVQYATEPEDLHSLLERFGEPLDAPVPHPARPPPQLELDWFDEPA